MRTLGAVLLVGWLVSGGCTKGETQPETATKVTAPRAPAAKVESPPPPEPPPEPPELHLEVLQERLAVGLSIQNRSAAAQQFSSGVVLEGEGDEVPLDADGACLTLRPGAESLWPADWDLSLAPDQSALEDLQGSYRFVVYDCERRVALRSDSFELPVRYY